MNRCYLVELTRNQHEALSPEVLGLATCLRGEGREWLLFRDNLVAYKVAKLTGGTVRCGQLLAETAPLQRTARGARSAPPKGTGDTLTLEGGLQVRLEAPVAVG